MDTPCRKKTEETCILFVGEGDFSFAANYIIKKRGDDEKVYASCLSNHSLTEIQEENIELIEKNGGYVFTDVDATHLHSHPEIKKVKFSRIIFNFPHIPGKMNIRKNRQLVEQFFVSATKVLVDSGEICVTLCQGQGGTEIETLKRKWCDTWQIVSLAASASLILYQIKAFDAKAFELYRCTGFRGLQKPFNTEGALTHIFKYGSPIDWNYEDITKNIDFFNIDLYLQSCESLHRTFYKNSYQPSFKVLSIVKDIFKSIFSSIYEKSIEDLFICKNNSENCDLKNILNHDFCNECSQYLFFQFLRNVKSCSIISVTCNISCMKIIDINKNPFSHIISYFSADAIYLLKCLPMFLEKLRNLLNLKKTDAKNGFTSKTVMENLIHKNETAISERFSVTTILNLYAKYSVNQETEIFYYSDIDFFLLKDGSNEVKPEDTLKIGTIMQYDYKFKRYFCIYFNLNTLAYLKYHIMDYRTVISSNSFYDSKILWENPVEIFRPLSLYPPSYVHDTSFYIDLDFCENHFFLVVRNMVGYLVKSITLIDSYYDKNVQKYSQCYRFIYQSYHKILTKDSASRIHSSFVRKGLRNSLNIQLR